MLEHDAQRKRLRLEMKGWPVGILSAVLGVAVLLSAVWAFMHGWK